MPAGGRPSGGIGAETCRETAQPLCGRGEIPATRAGRRPSAAAGQGRLGADLQETDMKRIALSALLATGLAAGAAHAQAPFASGGNGVGGGLGATLTGGGDDARVVYGQPGAGGGGMHLVQTGRPARFVGSDGGSPKFEFKYGAPAATDAGHEAWLTGGGGDAQVAYGRPR